MEKLKNRQQKDKTNKASMWLMEMFGYIIGMALMIFAGGSCCLGIVAGLPVVNMVAYGAVLVCGGIYSIACGIIIHILKGIPITE